VTDLPGPDDVREFWIGETAASAETLQERNRMWFRGGEALDAELRLRFGPLLDLLAAGPLAAEWAGRRAGDRLAAIIVLDQFSRNLFRGTPRAFAQDALAVHLCKEGLARGEDMHLSETERVFFYLPLEHSEDLDDQDRAVALFRSVHEAARPGYEAFTESTRKFAEEHRAAIRAFGRFPHRNAILGRESTPEEREWLAEGGGF
jgi:uncharacterized protein (DUF924 family)